jgi:hypothetical protein
MKATGKFAASFHGDWRVSDMKMLTHQRFSIAIAAPSRGLPQALKRDCVPTATVFPCPSDLETNLFE